MSFQPIVMQHFSLLGSFLSYKENGVCEYASMYLIILVIVYFF